MSGINSGIKQPLRFYDSPLKQNWRRCWVHSDTPVQDQVVICAKNSIIPFQIRRRRSPLPVTLFDLYSFSGNDFVFDFSLFTICAGGDTIDVIQMQQADNLVWNPSHDFSSDLDCGLHYVVVSDGVSTWYSEIFKVVDFTALERGLISILPVNENILQSSAIAYTRSGGDHVTIILHSKPH